MVTSATPRYCERCGARLAGDNADKICRPCDRKAHEHSQNPPEVPAEFWENDQLRDALIRERHIGHAVQSYRKHPFHGRRPISQETAARWLSVSQTQLSRIENGRPLYDLDRLIQWANILRIPPDLLWFALPDEEDDVKRRQFLLAGSAAAAGFLPTAAVPGAGSVNTPSAEACAQWLAWELWNRREMSLNAEEVPPQIRGILEALPPAGSLILRDADNNYSFAHPSLVDFFVAQRVFSSLAKGNADLLATAQTSHGTDQVIRRFVQHQDSCVPVLTRWMRDGATPVLRVNSAGILAKLGPADISDEVIAALKRDEDTRHLYLTAVASRVLAMPWEEAGKFAGSSQIITSGAAMSPERAAELAVQLGREVRHSQDGAARWCSLVLIGRIGQRIPPIVTSALQETLRREPCRENLRAIASTLSGADPLDV
jgi:transcriptional regulator with XRE-family HTH domain